jgi:hypothetical protein
MRAAGKAGVAALAFLTIGCGAQPEPGSGPPAAGADDTSTIRREFNPSYLSPTKSGHERITMKAIDYLARRGLLPPSIANDWTGIGQFVAYGAYFADNPWSGLPGTPHLPVANHMTARSLPGGFEYDHAYGTFDFEFTHLDWADPTAHVEAATRIAWLSGSPGRPSASLRYLLSIKLTPDVPLVPILTAINIVSLGTLGNFDDSPQQDLRQFGLDNFWHYSLGDYRAVYPSALDSQTHLKLFPVDAEHLAKDAAEFASWDFGRRELAAKLAARIREQTLLAGADFGSATYGAILYQLARKFFPGARAEPDLNELVKVGNTVPGRHTGFMQGHGELDEMHMSIPHTYLGGMPNVCSGSSAADPCETGLPTWPPWVRSDFPNDLTARETPSPGQNVAAAMIYLGWAAHMIQDGALPHHAKNWTGREHDKQDALGDIVDYYTSAYCDDYTGDCFAAPPLSMDNYMMGDVDGLLGTESAPKKRENICAGIGIRDSQLVPGALNFEAVKPIFVDNMRDAVNFGQPSLDPALAPERGREYVKNAILGTIKLLLCAEPLGIRNEWIGPISEEQGLNPPTCGTLGVAATAARCAGAYCDDLSLFCQPMPKNMTATGVDHGWTSFVSEESYPPAAQCPVGSVIDGIRASGGWADDISVHCTGATFARDHTCAWTPWFSEEQGTSTFGDSFGLPGKRPTAIAKAAACRGPWCDEMSFFVCAP